LAARCKADGRRAHSVGDDGQHPDPAPSVRRWATHLRDDGHVRASDRTDHRRVADRHLRLAVDFFHQHFSRSADVLPPFHYLECDEAHPELLGEGDYIGIFCMALGLGSLEYVLEEGERKDWFGNPLIQNFAIVAAIFIALFLIRELTIKKPFVDLRVFRHLRFTLSTLISLRWGWRSTHGLSHSGLPGTNPGLQPVPDWHHADVGGAAALVLLPFVPKLMKIIDPRVVAGIGLALFGGSCIIDGFLSPDFAMDQFAFPILFATGPAADFRAAAEHVDRRNSAQRSGLSLGAV